MKNSKFNDSKSDLDDFKTPKAINKVSKILNVKPCKNIKKKKKTQVPLTKFVEANLSHTDVNADHLQMALALSESSYEAENPNSQEKINSFREAFEKFGFGYGKGKISVEQKKRAENSKKNKKSRFRYVTPTLKIRTSEERESLISSKVSLILAQNDRLQPLSLQQENLDLFSAFLQKFSKKKIFAINNLQLEDLNMERRFYIEGFGPSSDFLSCGSLLKDWRKIPGREPSPERFVVNEESCETPLFSLTPTNSESGKENMEPSKLFSLKVSPTQDNKRDFSVLGQKNVAHVVDLTNSDESSNEEKLLKQNVEDFDPLKFSTTCEKETKDEIVIGKYVLSDEENIDEKNTQEFNEKSDLECFSIMTEPGPSEIFQKMSVTDEKKKKKCVEEDLSLKHFDASLGEESWAHFNEEERSVIGNLPLDQCDEVNVSRSHTSEEPVLEIKDSSLEREKSPDLASSSTTTNKSFKRPRECLSPDLFESFEDDQEVSQEKIDCVDLTQSKDEDRISFQLNFSGPENSIDQQSDLNITDYVKDLLATNRTTPSPRKLEKISTSEDDSKEESCSQSSIYLSDDEVNYSSVFSTPHPQKKAEYNFSDDEEFGITELSLAERLKLKLRSSSSPKLSTPRMKDFSSPLKHKELDFFNEGQSVSPLKTVSSPPKNKELDSFNEAQSVFPLKAFSSPPKYSEPNSFNEARSISPLKTFSPLLLGNCLTETPDKSFNTSVILKTDNVTPMANYDAMNTPQIRKELDKFGLKPLKRSKGAKLLKYIYDSTHPVIEDEDGKIVKKRRSNFVKFDDIIGDVGEDEDLIFERTQSKRVLSCRLPLHIAWHNLVMSNPKIREDILLYEPLQLEVLHLMLKEQGFKYHIQVSFKDLVICCR